MSFPVCRTAAVAALAGLLLPAGTGAASPSLRPDMPSEVLSLREECLSPGDYSRLAASWREYAADHPGSAVARVMQSHAMRYAGEGTVDERVALLREAYEIDPSCPEALEALAGTCLGEGDLGNAEARTHAERAIEVAPDWPRPHFTLWGLAMEERDLNEAAGHARALIAKGGIPAPLLDFGHNLLASADEGAIIFTNGDNDTYPPLAVQAQHGYRTDVRIVNLSMLNILDYAVEFLGDGPLTEKEIRALHDGWKERHRETGLYFNDQLLARILEEVRSGRMKRPVYLSVTVAGRYLENVHQKRRIEGLLWRVLPEPNGHADDADPAIAVDRTLNLFRRDFRLDSATDLAFPWERRSAVRQLMKNYPAVLRIVATRSAERGDLASVRFALDPATRILGFHGEEETLAEVVEYWDEIDPDRPGRDR